MEKNSIDRAADILAAAHANGERPERLPEASRPKNTDEIYAIQRATLARLGGEIAGWKVSESAEYGVLLGIILRSRVFASRATVAVPQKALRGMEAEIAFRFDHPLPPRKKAYDRTEVMDAVSAFPAIEIVDTRFKSYNGTPAIERAADFLSNGGFVAGPIRRDWRSFDLSRLEARLVVDGKEIVRRVGGHGSVDPLIPAIALANYLRTSDGIAAGTVVTTGTFTGMERVGAASTVEAVFTGFGSAACRLRADKRRG